jgi:hypothetical protein
LDGKFFTNGVRLQIVLDRQSLFELRREASTGNDEGLQGLSSSTTDDDHGTIMKH